MLSMRVILQIGHLYLAPPLASTLLKCPESFSVFPEHVLRLKDRSRAAFATFLFEWLVRAITTMSLKSCFFSGVSPNISACRASTDIGGRQTGWQTRTQGSFENMFRSPNDAAAATVNAV